MGIRARHDPEMLAYIALGVVGFVIGVSSLLMSGELLPLLMFFSIASLVVIAFYYGREYERKSETGQR